MQKIFSIFFLIFVASSVIFGQATVNIPLSAGDGSATIQLAVGLDMTATNGIDPGLGESDLPPFPPAGVFEIRFDLTLYAGEPLSSYKDYRFAAGFPFSGQVQHSLIWQRSAPTQNIDIQYNVPAQATMTIKDMITGTILNSGPLTGVGTYTIPSALASLNAAFVVMDYTVVPVELTSFIGSVLGDGVLLKWTTATELNNRGFEIERSTETQDWSVIGFVPGNGTTTELHSYSFTDNEVANDIYYYRLKQIDFSGQFEYSPEIEVVVDLTPQNFELNQNFPNPFNPTTSIQFQVPKQSDVSIIVYDLLGQQVKSLFAGQVQAGSYTVQWDGTNNAGSKMSSGTYIYRMNADNFIQTKEMVLLK